MFVVTKKCHESVVVGGGGGFEPVLKVTVLEIANGRVKLGFEADPPVQVRHDGIWNDFAKGIWHRAPNAVPVLVPAHKV